MFLWEGMDGLCANTAVLNKGLESSGFGAFGVEVNSLSQSLMDERWKYLPFMDRSDLLFTACGHLLSFLMVCLIQDTGWAELYVI